MSTLTASAPSLSLDRTEAASDRAMPALAAMRFAAAMAVIWTHSAVHLVPSPNAHPGDLFRFGSAFFTQCTIFLCLFKRFRTPDADVARYAASRFRRVYLPFLGWTAIYVGLKLILIAGGRKDHDVDLSLSLLWNGGEFHLWFLPFALVAGVVVFAAGGWIRPQRRIAVAVAFTLIGAALAPLSVLHRERRLRRKLSPRDGVEPPA